MNDQAAELRNLRLAVPAPHRHGASGQVYVIGSGKGGVGKSVLAVHLAAALARRGERTLLHDGSQNQGNLHILLGQQPAEELDAVLSGTIKPAELVVPIADHLALLPGNSGAQAMYALSDTDRVRLHHRLMSLYDDFDAVVIDAGPGLDGAIRMSIVSATRLIVVAVPEPASLSDAYALIKLVHLQAPNLPVEIMVNRTSSEEEARTTFELLNLAARRFLHRSLHFLATIPEEPSLPATVRRPGALLQEVAHGAVAQAIERAAETLVLRAAKPVAASHG